MARRSDHSREEIREMALAAAEQIVAEEGFDGLSTRKIAAAIGYTVGTLYLVFHNLDDLVLRLNGRTLDDLHKSLAQTAARCKDPRACIIALGRAYIRFATENTNRWSMIYEHGLPEGEPSPDWFRAKVAQIFLLVEDALRPLAKARSKRQIEQAARALWGGVHGICVLALSNTLDVAGIHSVRSLTDSLISNYLDGFTRKSLT